MLNIQYNVAHAPRAPKPLWTTILFCYSETGRSSESLWRTSGTSVQRYVGNCVRWSVQWQRSTSRLPYARPVTYQVLHWLQWNGAGRNEKV